MTSKSVQTVNPTLCPLCAKDNACGSLKKTLATDYQLVENNLACNAEKKLTCWCQDPNIQFPPQLLEQVPEHLKNKTCICQSCAREFKV